MNALIPTSKPRTSETDLLDAKIARLDEMSTDELRAELASALGLTATGLRYLAAVWEKLEKRGDDLSNLRTGIGVYLPAIAAGTVLPETVVGFAGQPLLLKAVADLPPEEQRRLVDGGTVPVVVRQGDGYTHRMLPVSGFDARLTRQVFGNRTIRNESEQIARLTAAAKPPAWKPGRPVKRGKVTVDRGAGVVRIGRMDAEIEDVVSALRQCGVIP